MKPSVRRVFIVICFISSIFLAVAGPYLPNSIYEPIISFGQSFFDIRHENLIPSMHQGSLIFALWGIALLFT